MAEQNSSKIEQSNEEVNQIPTTTTTNGSTPATSNSGVKNITDYEKGLSVGRKNLRKWLGKTFRVVITDGRVLIGFFNCTDKDANIVLSMCAEYLEEGKDARILGNVMIPGKHIVSISVDMPKEDIESTDNPQKQQITVQN